MEIDKIFADSDRKLKENPFDCIHAEIHHDRTLDNCQTIVLREKLTGFDSDALNIAALWHDVEKGSEKHGLLRKSMQEAGANRTFIRKVVDIIDSHTFGCKQESLEAKILFDADKLEYLSIDRLQVLLTAFNSGKISPEKFNYYKKEWTGRIKTVGKSLHFSYTRRRFREELPKLRSFMKKNPLTKDMAESIYDIISPWRKKK